MSPEELAKIETRLKAATPGRWAVDALRVVRGTTVVCTLPLNYRGPAPADADFIAHAPSDIAALLAEVRRLTPAPRIAVWEAGVDDYEGCAVLRDPATGAVLGWYNQADWGGCIWAEGEFPGAKRKVTKHAAKNGWEVRDA